MFSRYHKNHFSTPNLIRSFVSVWANISRWKWNKKMRKQFVIRRISDATITVQFDSDSNHTIRAQNYLLKIPGVSFIFHMYPDRY